MSIFESAADVSDCTVPASHQRESPIQPLVVLASQLKEMSAGSGVQESVWRSVDEPSCRSFADHAAEEWRVLYAAIAKNCR